MYNPDKHKRRSIRLRNYDYANVGAYFVTVCLNERITEIGRNFEKEKGQTHGSAPTITTMKTMADTKFDFPTLGYIENDVMILNDFGEMVEKWILKIKNDTGKFSNINLGEYIIMPDHVHAIVEIHQSNIPETTTVVGADPCVCPNLPIKLGTVIQWFKAMVSNEYIENVKTNNWIPFNKRLWQRNFWEHIIRDEQSYKDVSQYIIDNPVNWGKDELFHVKR